ncbi:hypothetical protein [Flavobacterium taihuense]|uniref:HNH endonuclease n=1 Tax=Flavobacterium taihuense TaxID=2857508 RepID=A0ABS6XWZ4_9FLAO|nr:hypothetical protein [Flavobacterium taihuense]MBW4361089.1 hypothetical protein [Flavobacterium taihuense]
MLFIENYSAAKQFHNELLKCWFLTKMNGRHNKNNNKLGHNCNSLSCPVCSKNTHRDSRIPQIFKDFLNHKKNLEILIEGKPNELRLLNLRYEKLNLTSGEKDIIADFLVNSTYKNWFQPEHGHKFLQLLNYNTCVYCNRNYTKTIIDVNGKKILICEFDHWFVKTKFPLLAVSFYNLIPSCHPCNSSIKGEPKINWDRALKNYIHPYLNEKNQYFNFSYVSKSLTENNVRINVVKNSKMDNTLKLFKTFEIYNSHSSMELQGLIDLRHKYPENYIKTLFKDAFNGGLTEKEIYILIFGVEVEEKDYHKRPLAKFKHEIIKELIKEN